MSTSNSTSNNDYLDNHQCINLKNDLNYACNNIFRKNMFTSKNYMGLHIKADLDCSKLLDQFNKVCRDNANKPSER